MKKLIALISVLLFISIQVKSQNGNCRIEYSGKLLFIKSMPVEKYTVVGKAKYSASKKNEEATIGDVTGLHKVTLAIDDVMKKVSKGKQADFDAVIVYSPIKMELIKFTSTDKLVYAKCNVPSKDYIKKCGSKEFFFLSKPIKSYSEVKELEVTNFTNIGQLKMGKDEIDNFMNKLYERSCKEAKDGVDFDAILFDDNDILNKKGYLTPRNIKLIKYN